MHRALSVLMILWSATAHADVLLPAEVDAHDRFRKQPDVWDRTDQYCDGRKVNDVCHIPGTKLAGGGAGVCKRVLEDRSSYVDLKCDLDDPIYFDRKYPDGKFQLINRECSKEDSNRWSCEPPPRIADQFCTGKNEGDACTVAYRQAAKRSGSEDGRCRPDTETREGYWQGRLTLSRPVLSCQAIQPLPPVEMRPVSTWKKLLPW